MASSSPGVTIDARRSKPRKRGVTKHAKIENIEIVAVGTQGMLDLGRHAKPIASGAGAFTPGPIRKETAVEPVDCPDHFLNWLQCLRSREAPVAPIDAGYQHSIACILSDRAYETGRRQVYNAQRREIREG